MSIDIIIPIYNAYDYTVECIKSVLEHTDMNKHRLILINDKSPDERIEPYLNELIKEKKDNIHVIHNEVNLGFVGTVNKGMQFSENDVVLLNSDTEVTERWLEKLERAAYLNERIASVTPLTNNGTICSVPNFCEDNEIPKNLSLNEYANIIEQTSLELYPSIPTAVGFCMYIKRSVIEKVGLFDQETFGKGYGEENDFCCRAIEYGYYHILCDNTFVYHKGSTSFLGDKEKFINNNLRILNKRYPYYDGMIQEFVQSNPLKSIHENVKLQIKLRNKNTNVLFVVHNDFLKGENHPVGGTEYHTKDIVDHLENTNSFIVYLKEREVCVDAIIGKEVTKFKFKISDKVGYTEYSNYNYKCEMSKIIEYFNIDCIHIQHLRTHTLDTIDIAKEKRIPIYITLHDFYSICPKVNLLDGNGIYCLNTRNKDQCKVCIRKEYGYNEDVLKEWNRVYYEKLKMIDRIFVPSQSSKRIIEDYYRNIYEDFDLNIEVKEHGVDLIKVPERINRITGTKFKVAFIGGLAPYKGSKIAYELINSNQDIEWHIFGNLGDYSLETLEKPNLIKHGRYKRDEIVNLLVNENIDLVCILSIWPETYSYTISEAIVANVPVIAMDIGALGDRVKEYKCGWIIGLNSTSKQILMKIEEIANNIDDYNEKLNQIKQVNLPSKSQVANFYNRLYMKSKYTFKSLGKEYNYRVLSTYKVNNNSDEYIIQSSNESQDIIMFLREENERLTRTIDIMQSTIGWRSLNYIRKNMPGVNRLGKGFIRVLSRYKK